MNSAFRRGGAMLRVTGFACIVWFMAGCSGSDDGGTGPGPTGDPHMSVAAVFSGSDPLVYSVRPDWSANDDEIIFAGSVSGSTGAHVFRVAAATSSAPVAVTDPDSSEWEAWGYTPACLGDGRIAWYLGWIVDDHDMHIMVATPGTTALDPPPAVLHAFNGSDFGWTPGSAASPDVMSISGDGDRMICRWGSTTYALDWSGGSLVVTPLTAIDATSYDPVISRDGAQVAWWCVGSHVVTMPFAGGTPDTLADGMYPTFSGDGLIGYVRSGFDAYVVHDPGTGTSVAYEMSGSMAMQYPTLSWDGTRVVFRTFGGPNTGLSIGTLVP